MLSKDGFSQWGSTPLKEWNIRKLHITEYYPTDDQVLRNSEITDLSVSGRWCVAQHYFQILKCNSTSTNNFTLLILAQKEIPMLDPLQTLFQTQLHTSYYFIQRTRWCEVGHEGINTIFSVQIM